MRDSFLLLSVLAALASARPQSIVTGPTRTASGEPEVTLVIPCASGEKNCVARTITVEERGAEETVSIPAFPSIPTWALGSVSVSVNVGGGTTQTATILPRDPEPQISRTVNESPPPLSTSIPEETVTVTVTDTVTPTSTKKTTTKKSTTKNTTTESSTSESSHTLSESTSGDISRSATTYFKRQSLGSVTRSASIPPTEPTTTTTKKSHHSSSSSTSKHHTHEARQALGSPSRSVWEWPWPVITITDIITVTDILTELPSVGRSVNTDGGSTRTATVDSASPDSVLTARQQLGSPSRSVLESPSPIPTSTKSTSSYVWTEWPWGPITPPIISDPLTVREADPEPQSLVGSPSRTVNEWPPPPPTPTPTIIKTVTVTDTVTAPPATKTHIWDNLPARNADPEPQSLAASPSRTVDEWPGPWVTLTSIPVGPDPTVTDILPWVSIISATLTSIPVGTVPTITAIIPREPQSLVGSPSRSVGEWPWPSTSTTVEVVTVTVTVTPSSTYIGETGTSHFSSATLPSSFSASTSTTIISSPFPTTTIKGESGTSSHSSSATLSSSLSASTSTISSPFPTTTSVSVDTSDYSTSRVPTPTTGPTSSLTTTLIVPIGKRDVNEKEKRQFSIYPGSVSVWADTTGSGVITFPTTVPDLPVIVPINERDASQEINEEEKRQFSIYPGSVSVWAASTGSPGIIFDEDANEKEKRQFSIGPVTGTLWAASTGTGSPSVIILTERAPLAQEIVGTATRSFTFDGSSPTTTAASATAKAGAGVKAVRWHG